MSPRSIRSYLTLMVLAAVVPLLAVNTFGYFREYRANVRAAEASMVTRAQALSGNVRQLVVEVESVLAALAQRPAVRSLDPADCDPVALGVPALQPYLGHVMIIDAAGLVPCTTLDPPEDDPSRLRDASTRDYYRVVLDEGRFYVDRPRTGFNTGRSIVVMSHPILDEGGRVIGAVALSVDLLRLQSLLTNVPLPPGGIATITDSSRVVVARSVDPEAWVGDTIPALSERDHFQTGAGVERATALDGTALLWGYAAVPEAGWVVYVGVPSAGVLAPARQSAVNAAFLALATLLIVGALSLYVHARVTGSLSELVTATEAAVRGETDRVSLVGVKEVASVAEQFNQALAARAEADRSRSEVEGRHAAIMEGIPVGVCQVTPDGAVQTANAFFWSLAGVGPDVADALHLPDLLVDPEDWDAILRSAGGNGGEGLEVQWRPGDDGPRFVRVLGSRSGEGAAERVDLTLEDVTDRRRAQRELDQAQKLDALGRMASGVAHDFNNVLTVIRGRTELLLDGAPPDSDDRRDLEQIEQAALWAGELTSQLLAFGRRESADDDLLDVNERLRQVESMARSLVSEEIDLTIHHHEDLAPVVLDPGHFEQLILNLLINARDAIDGPGRVEVTSSNVVLAPDDAAAELASGPGEYVRLTVSDSGPGMPPDVADRVFEPFFTTKTKEKGTGLGLSTVYGIVHQAGGHIRLETEPGKGTTFEVLLPARRDLAHERHGDPDDSHPPATQRTGTILVAEDQKQLRSLVARILEGEGHRVLLAVDGTAALEIARAHDGVIDVLLTDIVMPGMRGDAVAAIIRQERPEIRVCFMSGFPEPAGATVPFPDDVPFLAKPFTPADLRQHIASLLGP